MSRRDRRAVAGVIETNGRFVESLASSDCRLIIAPTLCFSDIECFEDTVRFENLNPAPAPVSPLEARVFVLEFSSRFLDDDTIRKTVRYRVFIRYLAENGTTAERTIDRIFTQEVDVEGQCEPDVCANERTGSFLCRVTDLCVRRACVEDDEDIVVEIVGRLALELFVQQRLCVQLCPTGSCPQGIEAASLCIENTDCVRCTREELEASEENCCCNGRNRVETVTNGCRTCR